MGENFDSAAIEDLASLCWDFDIHRRYLNAAIGRSDADAADYHNHKLAEIAKEMYDFLAVRT